MFFPNRIKSIKKDDYVLEIGPGGAPNQRANVLLEKIFNDPNVAEGQRGFMPALKTDKKIIFYEGGKFPFKNKEFDYIICSHVLEHIADVNFFISEINRIGKAGYFEYPLIYYDFVYNFPEHTTFVKKQKDTIFWMLKEDTELSNFKIINTFFYESLKCGNNAFVNELRDYIFEGFEWFDEIKSIRTTTLNDLVYHDLTLPKKKTLKINYFKRLKQLIERNLLWKQTNKTNKL